MGIFRKIIRIVKFCRKITANRLTRDVQIYIIVFDNYV